MLNGQVGQLLRHPAPIGTTEEQTDAQLLKRFASHHDQGAFAVLVKRHGPMVLAVCRRVLRDSHDADDAFQATFMVLVRKAGSLTRPELVGNWLYGVAYRVAVKARGNAARRSEYERRSPVIAPVDPMLEVTGRELRSVLDAEMSHLPEKYRSPLILCYLEGKTNEEAARLLGWPTGSMSGRLARGRELLRKRLLRKGLTLSAGIFAMLLSKSSAAAAVPDTLCDCTIRGAVFFARAAPGAASAAVSPSVAALAEEVLEALRLSALRKKLSVLIALLIVALIGLSAVGVAYAAYNRASGCA